jgi:putative redox protein
MVTTNLIYDGGLQCHATHGPSGYMTTIDAPTDVGGLARAFSPTDLLGTALGSCIAITMGLVAKKHGVDLTGMALRVEKVMSDTNKSSGPRRIIALNSVINVPLPHNHPQREALEYAAHNCPVHASLHPDIAKNIIFEWQ